MANILIYCYEIVVDEDGAHSSKYLAISKDTLENVVKEYQKRYLTIDGGFYVICDGDYSEVIGKAEDEDVEVLQIELADRRQEIEELAL